MRDCQFSTYIEWEEIFFLILFGVNAHLPDAAGKWSLKKFFFIYLCFRLTPKSETGSPLGGGKKERKMASSYALKDNKN